ncbi:MAG: putative bifunctional diguanylate cyclase/phosphodiesterase [Actinomycetota bacterium]
MARGRALFVVVVVLVLASRLLLPSTPSAPAAVWLCAVMAASVAGMVVGIRRNKPDPDRGWGFVVLGVGVYTAAVLLGIAARYVGEPTSRLLLTASVSATLASFVLLPVGAGRLLRVRGVRLDWAVGIDAAMLAIGFGYFVWELVFAGRALSPLVVALTYGNVLVASVIGAMCLRVGSLTTRPPTSYRLMLAALACGTTGTILRVTGMHAGWDTSLPVSMLMGSTWMLAAATILHPSMREPLLGGPPPAAMSLPRLWVTAGALLAVPMVAVHSVFGLDDAQTGPTVAVTGILSVLGITRVARSLMGHQRALGDAERSAARFRSLVQHAYDPVAIVDRQGVVQYASPAIRGVTGYGPEDFEGSLLTKHVHADDVATTAERIAETVQTGDTSVFELRVQHHQGGFRWLEVVAADHSDQVDVEGIVLNMRDVTDRKAAEGELSRLALYDPLTGLPNRMLLADRLRQALARARRTRSTVAVIFLDLDRFKLVNDSLGHDAGDRLLVAVAARLRSALRDSTTLARFGGDEFVALCEDLERDEHAIDVADRMLAALSEDFPLGPAHLHMGGSIGIAFGDDDATPESLVRDADAAMYLAKARGNRSIEVFNAELRHRAVARLELESALRRGIEDGELRLLFQPIIRLCDGCVSGAEALVRWEHPQHGLLTPDAFIPMAEDTGLILPLGDWVIQEALSQLRTWDATIERGLAVSVNLSAIQLGVNRSGMSPVPRPGPGNGRPMPHETLVQRLREMLERSGVAPGRLNLEITESVLMDGEGASTVLQELKDVGVRVAVDDFGTGYSGLSYLKRLPADIMKIDRSFLTGIAENRADRALVETMIGLAHNFNMCVVAEGVETIEQLIVLAALGCDYAQGYLIAHPMAGEELIRRYVAQEEPFAGEFAEPEELPEESPEESPDGAPVGTAGPDKAAPDAITPAVVALEVTEGTAAG